MSETISLDTSELSEQIDYQELFAGTPLEEELEDIESPSSDEIGGALGAMIGRRVGARLGPQFVTALQSRMQEASDEGETTAEEDESTASAVLTQAVELLVDQLLSPEAEGTDRLQEMFPSGDEGSEEADETNESEQGETGNASDQGEGGASDEQTDESDDNKERESDEPVADSGEDQEESGEEPDEEIGGDEDRREEFESELEGDTRLESRSYREIQALAQSRGIDARQDRDALIDDLEDAVEVPA